MDGSLLLFATITECSANFNISRSVIYDKLVNGSSIESLNILKNTKIRVFNYIKLPYNTI